MVKPENQKDYTITADEYYDTLFESSRLAVLDGFEQLAEQIAQNLEEFYGYGDIQINYTGPLMETFVGPVMNGAPKSNSRSYNLSGESEVDFEVDVKDSSMAFMASEEGLMLDAENEYRDLIFSYEEGSQQLYNDFVEEFRNLLGVNSSQYRRNQETMDWEFKFQREDVKGL